ncbi:hypothetical protein [Porphyrobacter sp. AAP60]|uniref:hypothetical protein n=1 Tax=Porphyrobacter sp. AAP60 TaxID=1523423 RepID=UPI0006B9AAB9|nr:hypothetical protein [Porphyrobacter sp. AAP60]KPF63984.1 hypothetical protein IP79_09350 [Porphyrobacter sp. AAP60]
MNRAVLHLRGGHGWQLILADLALILFLLTLSALPAAEAESGHRLADREARAKEARPAQRAVVASSQALFRPVADGPGLSEWFRSQPRDPRATLTIFATYGQGGEAAAWAKAQAMADEARASGARVRTIIAAGAEADVYASLAYDTVI